MMRALFASLFVVSFSLPAAAAPILSAEGPDAPVPYKLWLGGSYRISGQTLSDLRLDSDGNGQADAADDLYGQSHLATHRLRFTPALEIFEGVRLDADLQLATGFLSVDNPADRYAPYGPPRSDAYGAGEDFSAEVWPRLEAGQIECGQQRAGQVKGQRWMEMQRRREVVIAALPQVERCSDVGRLVGGDGFFVGGMRQAPCEERERKGHQDELQPRTEPQKRTSAMESLSVPALPNH